MALLPESATDPVAQIRQETEMTTTATPTVTASLARRAARATGCAGLAAALVLGVAGTAAATSPPAPAPAYDLIAASVPPLPGPGSLAAAPTQPGPDPAPSAGPTLADAPPVASGHRLSGFGAHGTDVFMELDWSSTASTVILQVSRDKPTLRKGRLSMPTQPIVVTGDDGTAPDPNAVAATAPEYDFVQQIDGLRPDTEYQVLLTVPVGPGYLPVQRWWSFRTKVRHVAVDLTKITVIQDADKGLRGRGEIDVQPRIAPADPTSWGTWGKRSATLKLGDGDSAWFNPLLRHATTTRSGSVVVQVQGCEVDAVGRDRCINEGNDAPRQGRWIGQDWSFAEGTVTLPATRYSGSHSQTRTIEVHRSPDLRFTAKVTVTTWYE